MRTTEGISISKKAEAWRKQALENELKKWEEIPSLKVSAGFYISAVAKLKLQRVASTRIVSMSSLVEELILLMLEK